MPTSAGGDDASRLVDAVAGSVRREQNDQVNEIGHGWAEVGAVDPEGCATEGGDGGA